MKEVPETHVKGAMEVCNRDIINQLDWENVDFGLQVAWDGRVWVCINGIAFIRFKPTAKERSKAIHPSNLNSPLHRNKQYPTKDVEI